MELKKIKTMITPIGVLLILTFLAACSFPSNNNKTSTRPPQATQIQPTDIPATQLATEAAVAEATEPAATVEGGTPVTGEGMCANAYYPVRQGATWSYKSTGGPAGEYSFTDTITSVHENGFTLSTQVGNTTRSQEWTCTQEGLVALQLGGAPAAMLNSQNIQLDLDAKNVNGVTFPNQIQTGDQWQQKVDVEGNVSMGKEGGAAAGTATMNFTALGNESVSVPAGTFDAMKIQVDTSLDVSVKYAGLSLPIPFSVTYTYWFAPGVGWVKATGNGKLMGSSFNETTELQSYNIP